MGPLGLEGPGRNTDLLQEIGITIPRPPVKCVMSAVGEELPSPVALDGYAHGVPEDDDEHIVRGSVNGAGADLGPNLGTKTARNPAGLTCATAAGMRCALLFARLCGCEVPAVSSAGKKSQA
eukprot:8577200-Pyramimonas_sp.AAC.1